MPPTPASTGPHPLHERYRRDLDLLEPLIAPWRWATDPQFFGLEHVSQEPALYVGNHTLFGLLDAPLMHMELFQRKGIFLRALGDHLHFKIPLWRRLLSHYGVSDGTRDNCSELMRAGESILVFPGGGREVAKCKGERYKLIWEGRTGFARMALEHGYTIQPFAAVGVEDFFDVLADHQDLLNSPVGPSLQKLPIRTNVILPWVKGVGPTPLPRLQRLYFRFGPPVRTKDADFTAEQLKAKVQAQVEADLASLRQTQAADPMRSVGSRLRAFAKLITS